MAQAVKRRSVVIFTVVLLVVSVVVGVWWGMAKGDAEVERFCGEVELAVQDEQPSVHRLAALDEYFAELKSQTDKEVAFDVLHAYERWYDGDELAGPDVFLHGTGMLDIYC